MGSRVMHNDVFSLVILSGQTVSDVIPIGEFSTGSVQAPAAITGSSFQVEVGIDVRGVFVAVGNALTLSADELVALPSEAFIGSRMRLVSDATELATRTFSIFLKE